MQAAVNGASFTSMLLLVGATSLGSAIARRHGWGTTEVTVR